MRDFKKALEIGRFSQAKILAIFRPAILEAGFGLLLLLLILAPLAAHGIPSFEQDWQWPVHPSQCLPYARFGLQPWNSSGIGSAQLYPQPWLPYVISGGLCASVGPKLALLLYLAAILGIAQLGLHWVGAILGTTRFGRVVGASIYVSNPIVLNKIHAGHLNYLFSYAIATILVAVLLSPTWRYRSLQMGVLVGIASAQQQFFVFTLIVVFGFALQYGLRWLLVVALPAMIIAIAVTAPQWILTAYTGASSFSPFMPFIHWQESQSLTFAGSATFVGYIGHYDITLLPGWTRALLWALPILAFLGLLTNIRSRIAQFFAALGMFGVLVVNGLKGPLQAPLIFAFLHYGWSAIFRELYNAEVLVILSYTILIMLFFSLQKRHAVIAKAQPVIVAALAFLTLTTAAQCSKNIPMFQLTPEAYNIISELFDRKDAARYLAVPSMFPQSLSGSLSSGLSPFTIPIGSHPPLLTSLAEYPATAIASRASSGLDVSDLLRMAGTSYILEVPGIRSVSNLEPGLKNLFRMKNRDLQLGWNLRNVVSSRSPRLELLSARSDIEGALAPLQGGTSVDLFHSDNSPDPQTGWARAAFWNNLPAWAYNEPISLFTLSHKRMLDLPANTSLVAGDQRGQLRSNDCVKESSLDTHFSLFTCKGKSQFFGTPPLVIGDARENAGTFGAKYPGSSIAATYFERYQQPWRISLRLDAPRNALLVLHERYDAGWSCINCNAVHVVADRYANAWLLTHDKHGTVTLEYRPARLYFLALTISVILSASCILYTFLQLSLTAYSRARQLVPN